MLTDILTRLERASLEYYRRNQPSFPDLDNVIRTAFEAGAEWSLNNKTKQKKMYTTSEIELAMNVCSYRLDRLVYGTKGLVKEFFGQVPIVKRVTVSGERRSTIVWKHVRWNSGGQCFLMYSTKRQRKYDLPIKNILEQKRTGL